MPQRQFLILQDPRLKPNDSPGGRRVESTKEIKKRRKQASKPVLNIIEQRRIDREEQDTIRRELSKEKSRKKVKEAREKKRRRIKEELREKKKERPSACQSSSQSRHSPDIIWHKDEARS